MPNLKDLWRVLWWKIFIPMYIPKDPPKKANRNKVRSGIRHFPFKARLLSRCMNSMLKTFINVK